MKSNTKPLRWGELMLIARELDRAPRSQSIFSIIGEYEWLQNFSDKELDEYVDEFLD